MSKRKTKKVVKNSGGAKWFAAIFCVLFTVTAGAGWWLLISDSKSETKKDALDKASLLVDRFDELSDAWKSRGIHEDVKQKVPVIDKTAEVKPVKVKAKPVLETKNKIEPIKAHDPHDDVDSEDKEELRSLLRQLNN